MNQPVPRPAAADDDLGPLDQHGQQIWSPEEAAAIARLQTSPQYRADIAAGLASVARAEGHMTESMLAELARRRAVR